jgi:hypothetical protein
MRLPESIKRESLTQLELLDKLSVKEEAPGSKLKPLKENSEVHDIS